MPPRTFSRGSMSPAENAFEITPGTAEFANPPRAIYVGSQGAIVVVTIHDEEVVFRNAQPGSRIDIRAKKVLAETTGSPTETTTATGLIGMY